MKVFDDIHQTTLRAKDKDVEKGCTHSESVRVLSCRPYSVSLYTPFIEEHVTNKSILLRKEEHQK
jgi:hypothetical protein